MNFKVANILSLQIFLKEIIYQVISQVLTNLALWMKSNTAEPKGKASHFIVHTCKINTQNMSHCHATTTVYGDVCIWSMLDLLLLNKLALMISEIMNTTTQSTYSNNNISTYVWLFCLFCVHVCVRVCVCVCVCVCVWYTAQETLRILANCFAMVRISGDSH